MHSEDQLKERRQRLLDNLRKKFGDDPALRALSQMPRELFVPLVSRNLAYEDIPLPIGEGQTISQPQIIVCMTSILHIKPNDRILEIGTGSGYQTAILAQLAHQGMVISTERIPALAQSAKALLQSLGYQNIEILPAEQILGYPKKSPFDCIIVTAAAPRLPDVLLTQLAIGGRMVIPIGPLRMQQLIKVFKSRDGYSIESHNQCQFVPLIGHGAWMEEHILNP